MHRGADVVQQGRDDAGMTEAWHMAHGAHARKLPPAQLLGRPGELTHT
jgi:hypothetical protein